VTNGYWSATADLTVGTNIITLRDVYTNNAVSFVTNGTAFNVAGHDSRLFFVTPGYDPDPPSLIQQLSALTNNQSTAVNFANNLTVSNGLTALGGGAPLAGYELQVKAADGFANVRLAPLTGSSQLDFLVFESYGLMESARNFTLGQTGGRELTNAFFLNTRTNDFVLGTRYTNTITGGFGTRRATVSASFQLNAAAAGTARVTLFVEQGSFITNKLTIAAGPSASLVTIEPLTLKVNPNAVWTFVDETSGAGASVSFVGGTGSYFGE
jgi:hypothetical protein